MDYLALMPPRYRVESYGVNGAAVDARDARSSTVHHS